MSRNRFAAAPLDFANQQEWARKTASAVNQAQRGQTNNVFQVTLTAGVTTVITSSRITADTAIFVSPLTANAAGALATTYFTVVAGQITINHANAATLDRTFDYILVG